MSLREKFQTFWEDEQETAHRHRTEILRMTYDFGCAIAQQKQSWQKETAFDTFMDILEKKAQDGSLYALHGMGIALEKVAGQIDDSAPCINRTLDRLEKYLPDAEEDVEDVIVTFFLTPDAVLYTVSDKVERQELQDKALNIVLEKGDRAKLCAAEKFIDTNGYVMFGPLVEVARKNPDMADRVIDELRQENRHDVKKAVSHILEALVVTPDHTTYALDKADALTEERFFTQEDASGVLDAVFQENNLTHPVDVTRAQDVIDTLEKQYPGKKALLPSFQQAVEDAIARQEEAQQAARQGCRCLYG